MVVANNCIAKINVEQKKRDQKIRCIRIFYLCPLCIWLRLCLGLLCDPHIFAWQQRLAMAAAAARWKNSGQQISTQKIVWYVLCAISFPGSFSRSLAAACFMYFDFVMSSWHSYSPYVCGCRCVYVWGPIAFRNALTYDVDHSRFHR